MFLLSGKFLHFKTDVSSRYKFHIKYKKLCKFLHSLI